jgi:suppressor for copper-sensitivity B
VASSAGIVVSFLVLGAILVSFKATGASVGWGIQFQHPWFLTALIVLVTLFACNLWGVVELRLPRWTTDIAASPSTAGLSGNFATGALATLLATPCSAPFVGTAVGFALAAGPADILAVFATMGAGLAAPYLSVAAFPSLARLLPRPGRWMGVVRFVLGTLLLGTAIWLLTVLAAVADIWTVAWVAGLVGLAAVLLGVRRWMVRTTWARLVSVATATACVVAAFAVPAVPGTSPNTQQSPGTSWHRFAEDDIAALVRAGVVVVVDVTAEWCLTCKVNEKMTLSTPAVLHAFADERVVAMRGDWTRPDARISAYMARFGRYGVPFNAVYGPGYPDGHVLPELLTPGVVTAAVDRALQKDRTQPAEGDGH